MNLKVIASRRLMPTYVLIALNTIAYVYTSIVGGDFIKTGDLPIVLYGQVNLLVWHGWLWQLFTAMFVHANIVHLAGNMFFLLIFGLRAEELFSTKEYLMTYILSGLAGNLLTLLLGPNMISVGASGAIFGLFGAVTIYIRRAVGQSIISALMYAFFLFFLSSGIGVNVVAHFGGLAVGLLLGYWLAATRKRKAITYQLSYGYRA
jgi:rhomboid protease GluP